MLICAYLLLFFTEAIVKKKWKSLRDYFIRQVRYLEKNPVSKVKSTKEESIINNDNVNKNIGAFKYCLWPLYGKLTFLTDNQSTPIKKNVRLNSEDRTILEEVKNFERQRRDGIETVHYYVSSEDSSSTFDLQQSNQPEIPSLEKAILPKPNLSCVAQLQPLRLKRLTSNSMPNVSQDNESLPNPTHTVTLSSTPQLIVLNPTLSSIQERDPLQEDSNRQEYLKKLKLESGHHDSHVQQNTDDDNENDDLQFFKSLLPFMRAFSLLHKLRVRNEIQSLILGELESVGHKTEYMDCLPHRQFAPPTPVNCRHTPKNIVDFETREEQVLDTISSPVIKEEAEPTEDESELLKVVYEIKSEPEIE